MHARKQSLLALAVAAALLPALALADKPTHVGHGNATPTPAATMPHPSMPTPAVEHAGDALGKNPNYDPANTRDVGKDAPPASDRPTADNDDDDEGDDEDQDDAMGGTHARASTSSAAQTNPGKGNWWADADGDSDGRISRTEATVNAGLNAHFSTIDADGDGFVTRDEYGNYYQASVAKGEQHAADHSEVVTRDIWGRFDANADGRLSATEIDLDARLKADFGAIDADDDGFVSDAEYRTYYQNH
jgi:hypothetical protein